MSNIYNFKYINFEWSDGTGSFMTHLVVTRVPIHLLKARLLVIPDYKVR